MDIGELRRILFGGYGEIEMIYFPLAYNQSMKD